MNFNASTVGDRPRRALLLGDTDSADVLDERLSAAGYQTLRADGERAVQVADEEEPDVLLVVLGEPDGDEAEEPVVLARRLRADERTFTRPLALVFHRDDAALRLAALGIGADDYFALSTPAAELCARLDSLLWRAEAGRLVPPPADEDEAVKAAKPAEAETVRQAETIQSDEAAAAPSVAESTATEEAAATSEKHKAEGRSAPADVHAPARVEEDKTRTRDVAAEEVARVFEDGRHVRAPVPATREARMIAALDASTERLTRAGTRAGALGASNTRAGRARRTGGPKRLLLIVSDAARMAQLNLLIRSAHYEVRTAFDARQALSLLRIERPDLLLVDYELKDMNGVEMLRRLREQQGGQTGPPSILFAPAGGDEARRDAVEIGTRAVVNLPYNPDELLDLIHAAGGAD